MQEGMIMLLTFKKKKKKQSINELEKTADAGKTIRTVTITKKKSSITKKI